MAEEKTQPVRRARGRPRAFNDLGDQNVIKALARALTVLEALSDGGDSTLTALSERLGEAPATLYRALYTFQTHGFADLDPATQAWHVGPDAFRVGSAFLRRTSLVERTRPVLRDLMEITGETANLGVPADADVLFVGQVETHASIRAFFPPGTRSPAHASGIGKALLAHYSDRRLDAVLRQPLERFTPRTICEPSALRAALAKIRAQGYSVDDEEKNDGMRCIAAPIHDHLGACIAGISVSGPTARVTPERVPDIARHVVAAARSVSRGMGHAP